MQNHNNNDSNSFSFLMTIDSYFPIKADIRKLLQFFLRSI